MKKKGKIIRIILKEIKKKTKHTLTTRSRTYDRVFLCRFFSSLLSSGNLLKRQYTFVYLPMCIWRRLIGLNVCFSALFLFLSFVLNSCGSFVSSVDKKMMKRNFKTKNNININNDTSNSSSGGSDGSGNIDWEYVYRKRANNEIIHVIGHVY